MDKRRIFLIIFILALIGGAYYYYQVYNITPTPEGGSSAIADVDTRLNDIRPLASVEFDTSIFNNVFFRSLQINTASTGPAVASGRSNPFVPYEK